MQRLEKWNKPRLVSVGVGWGLVSGVGGLVKKTLGIRNIRTNVHNDDISDDVND